MKILITSICLSLLLTAAIDNNAISAETLLDSEMGRLIYISEKYAENLRKSDLIYQDEDVTNYLQKIMRKLYPDYEDVFKIHIYNSSEINASATIDGHIYVRLGMLAKAVNEAQIASVLAHEGAHVIKNHLLESLRNQKWIETGLGLYASDTALAHISDYSIELEQEADDEGFRRLIAAKYDPKEAAKIFQSMANEAKIRHQLDDSLYSSHPKLLDRIDYFAKLSKGHSGHIGKETYLEKTSVIKLECLRRNITNYRFNSVLLDLDTNKQLSKLFPQSWFYIGEAYRQRAAENDANNSENAYLKAIELKPGFAPTYRALGILYMKKQQHPKALAYFDKYLAKSPDAQDKLYITEYYNEIKNSGSIQ